MAETRQLNRAQEIEIDHALAETRKYAAEQRTLEAEARYFDRNRWQIVVFAMTAGAALFGAGVAFTKLLIG
jgi:hypothetical protein